MSLHSTKRFGGSLAFFASNGGVALGRGFQWHGTTAPVFARRGDRDLIVGAVRYLVGDESSVRVAVFDAVTFEKLWESPHVAHHAQTVLYLHVAAGADRVAIASPNATLTFHDLATGDLLQQVNLSDRVRQVCQHPARPGEAWLAMADEQNMMVDLAAATLTPAPRPPDSPDPRGEHAGCPRGPFHAARCLGGSRELPEHAGVRLRMGLVLGEVGVAHGQRDPGTRTPVLVGFDPAARSVRWSRRLDEIHPNVSENRIELFDLVGVRVYAQIRLDDGTYRLLAFDARTGALAFDATIPDSDTGRAADRLRVHGGRIYLPRFTWLHILDAETGTHLRTLGRWR